ncbi:Myeloid leukemia factor 2 [Bienertia sinuspersici]
MNGRGGRDGFFDPFAGFGGFGGMGGHQSMISSFFGGRDPFDDPFFTRPFGSPFGSMFESGLFGSNGSPFPGARPAGSIEQQEPQLNKRRGPVIEELDSDDEHAEDGDTKKTKDSSRKHSRLADAPYVEIPDDTSGVTDGRDKHIQQHRNEFSSRMNNAQRPSQSQCYTFQSSSVSYGGANGAYYSKSMARRAGSDGVVFEELKEADSTTGQANHRISRGLHDKGHTLARKLTSDGKVDTRQTLHNLDEAELENFENAWEGSSGRHLTGGRLRLDGGNSGPGSTGQTSRGGRALPSTHLQGDNTNPASGNHSAHMQQTGKRAADRGSHGRKRA